MAQISELVGQSRFYREVSISAEEMRTWPAERIRQFFSGLAMAVEAAERTEPACRQIPAHAR